MKFLITDMYRSGKSFNLDSHECVLIDAQTAEEAMQKFIKDTDSSLEGYLAAVNVENMEICKIVEKQAYDLQRVNTPPSKDELAKAVVAAQVRAKQVRAKTQVRRKRR